jgi:hypothetical protein
MLQITDAGRAKVATPEFAEYFRDVVCEVKRRVLGQEAQMVTLATHVTLVLCGKENETPRPMTEAELAEFRRLMDDNAVEISDVIMKFLETWMIHDSDGQTPQ